MCECGKQSTEEMLAIRYPHLNGSGWLKGWLEQLNERIGWLKQNSAGNAVMQIPWKGGKPGETNWFIKITQGRSKQ